MHGREETGRCKVRSLRTKVSTCRRHLPGPFSLGKRSGGKKEKGKKILRFSRAVIHQVSNKSWVFLSCSPVFPAPTPRHCTLCHDIPLAALCHSFSLPSLSLSLHLLSLFLGLSRLLAHRTSFYPATTEKYNLSGGSQSDLISCTLFFRPGIFPTPSHHYPPTSHTDVYILYERLL